MARPELSKEARKVAAKAGAALPNGKYPIRNRRELRAAIKLRHRSTEPYAVVKAHILRRAAALGIKVKASQVASAVTAACHSSACAPPPAGVGGSCEKGGCQVTVHRKVSRGVMGKGTEKFGTKAGPCGKPKADGSDICAHHLAKSAKMDAKLMAKRERDAQLLATRKRLTSAATPGKTVGVSALVFACHDKACAPPPVGKGGSSKTGGVRKVDSVVVQGMASISRKTPGPGMHQKDDGTPGHVTIKLKSIPQVSTARLERAAAHMAGILRDPEAIRDFDQPRRSLIHESLRLKAIEHELSLRKGKKDFPVITAAEARGDSRPVSREKFQQMALIGQSKLDKMAENASPIKGLDDNWDQIKRDGYVEVQKSWGGATIDAHTGQALPQGANRYAMTVKSGGDSVSVKQDATEAEFNAAMDQAKEKFRDILERENHYLGIFHDDDLGRIDIDPVIVVDNLTDVHTIGAATRAIGGAYNFADGNGYWPPHVKE